MFECRLERPASRTNRTKASSDASAKRFSRPRPAPGSTIALDKSKPKTADLRLRPRRAHTELKELQQAPAFLLVVTPLGRIEQPLSFGQ